MPGWFATVLLGLWLLGGPSQPIAAAELGRCGDPATRIHEIQGAGPLSPLEGAVGVVVEALVVGDYQDPVTGLGGFFVQEEDAQARAENDPATSEGLFVFDDGYAVDVEPGDLVRVRGDVAELRSGFGLGVFLTSLADVEHVVICGAGGEVAPAVVTLPVDGVDVWERFEGMRISIPQRLTVTDNFQLGRFGQVVLARGRLFQPTALAAPGAQAAALRDLNRRSRLILDDGNRQQNRAPTLYPAPGLSAPNTLRAGDTLQGLVGVLDQRFGEYRLQPVGPIAFRRDNPRPQTPVAPGGRLRVASFNAMNYFTSLDAGRAECGPFANLRCRGADRASELVRQRAKLVSALIALDADIVGLMEIENDAGAALADLAAAANGEIGAETYAFLDTGSIGTDAIKVGFLYKPATVTPLGRFEIFDARDDPLFLDRKNRPALAQTFEERPTGARFTAVLNHLKSKGSACDDVGDFDAGDGQGNCNGVRTAAAQALARWLTTDPTGSQDSDFLVFGDLNAYGMEDPIAALEAAGYTDLVKAFGELGSYSFVFAGEAGDLDHALANASLLRQVTGARVWHVNADEPVALDYNEEFKSEAQRAALYQPDPFRSSDHDPLLVGLDLDAPPGCAAQRPGLDGRWPPDPGRRAAPALGPRPQGAGTSCPPHPSPDGGVY